MPKACNFIKRETLNRCFPVNFAEFLRTLFVEQLLLDYYQITDFIQIVQD